MKIDQLEGRVPTFEVPGSKWNLLLPSVTSADIRLATGRDTAMSLDSVTNSVYKPGRICLLKLFGETEEARALRDWSLITGRGGGATKWEVGAREVLPLRKGGRGGKSFSHAEGGHNKFYAVA